MHPTKTTTVPSGNSGTSLVKFGIPTRFKASSSRAAWYRGSSESTRAFDFTSSIRPMGVDPTGVILFTVGFHPALRNIAANSAAKMRDSGSLSIDVTIKGPFRNPAVRATKFVSCCSVTVRHWIRACSSASSFSALAVFSCWTDNCVSTVCCAAFASAASFCNPATLFSASAVSCSCPWRSIPSFRFAAFIEAVTHSSLAARSFAAWANLLACAAPVSACESTSDSCVLNNASAFDANPSNTTSPTTPTMTRSSPIDAAGTRQLVGFSSFRGRPLFCRHHCSTLNLVSRNCEDASECYHASRD